MINYSEFITLLYHDYYYFFKLFWVMDIDQNHAWIVKRENKSGVWSHHKEATEERKSD